MKIGFIFESSLHIGGGHVSRSLRLAREFYHHGFVVYILTTKNTLKFSPEVKKTRFHLIVVDKLEDLIGIDSFFNIIFLDNYQASYGLEKLLWKKTNLLVTIDDLANRKHYCDILIDPGVTRKAKDYLGMVPIGSKILCGGRYAILHEHFKLKKRARGTTSSVATVHFFAGRGDSAFTTRFIEIIRFLPKSFHYLVIGNHKVLNSRSRKRVLDNMTILFAQDSLAASLSASSFAIGAPGTALWERFRYQLPSLIFMSHPNQEKILKSLHHKKFCQYAKSWKDLNDKQLTTLIIKFLLSKNTQLIRPRLKGIVNPNGANLIYREVLKCYKNKNGDFYA